MNYRLFKSKSVIVILILLILGYQSVLRSAALNDVWHPLENGLQLADPEVSIIEETTDHLTVQWRLSGFFTEEIVVGKDIYYRIHYGDEFSPSISKTGELFYPALNEMIRIPDDASATATVIDVEWVYSGDYNLYPRQLPRRDDGSDPGPFLKSEQAYTEVGPFPEEPVVLGQIQGWGGLAVASLTVTPVRYYPASGRLDVARCITVRIDFHPGRIHRIVKPHLPSRKMNDLHRKSVLNPPDELPRRLDADEDEPIRMLVVLKEEALETAQPLIDFHHNSGIRTEVWVDDDIDDPQEVKDRVLEMYEDGLEYLFIIGDGYDRDPDIPMHYWDAADPGWQDPQSTASHSDHWFVCLDEPDGDGYEDHLPELNVGRLVYRDADHIDELEIQVDKLLDYMEWRFEDNDGEWLSRAILMAHCEFDSGFGGLHYINCKRFIAEHDYDELSPEFITFYGTDDDATNAAVIETINNTGVGILNYRGHGNNNLWDNWNVHREDWTASEVRQLENRNSPFILISCACKTANIATYGSDCLVESFQKHDGGSLSAHGSVISTYTLSGHFFDKQLFLTWFDEGIYDVGFANNFAITVMVHNWENDYYSCRGRMNARAYIWLGDPALEIKLTPPEEMMVDIPEFVHLGTDEIEAFISIDDEPLEGARICVRNEEEQIYVVGVSDEDGAVVLEFDSPLEEVIELDWMAYHRLGLPVTGSIIALDGTGAVEGTVSELADEDPIEEATVTLSRFNLDVTTDAEGRYLIEDIPSTDYELTADAAGFIPQTVNITILDDRTLIVDFSLAFSRLEADSMEINFHVDEGDTTDRHFLFTNTGNGALEWSASVDFSRGNEPYRLFRQYDAGDITDDQRLNGVEFIDGLFYIAGSNNHADPNYFYVIDQDGNYIDRLNQPEQCGGFGIFDLAWDGSYLYGSSSDSILQIDLEGNFMKSFIGPYSPNRGLTVDDEGNLWVSSNDQPLVKIDMAGNVLGSINNAYSIRALAWHQNASDDYKLLMFVRDEDEPDMVKLYKVHPERGDIRLAADLSAGDDETVGDGLSVSTMVYPGRWTLIGIVDREGSKYLKLWNLSIRNDWLTIEPEAGSVEPDDEDEIILTFSTFPFSDGFSCEVDLVLENNSAEPTIEIPILFQVGIINSVEITESTPLPVSYKICNPYPNPFNSRTVVPFELPNRGTVVAAVYDISGRRVVELASGRFDAGRHLIAFESGNLPSGVYMVSLEFDGRRLARKVVLMR